jgi:Periplasmic binding protein
MRTTSVVRTAAGAIAVMVLTSGCQSTTRTPEAGAGPASGDNVSYPGRPGSPGLTDGKIHVGTTTPSKRTSTFWPSSGPVHLAVGKLISDINAQGGVVGSELEQVPMYDGVRGDEKDQLSFSRAQCNEALVKRPVFAMSAPTYGMSVLQQAGCLGPKRVVNVVLERLVSAAEMAKTPDAVAPYALDDLTAAHTLAKRLDAQGFFTGARKIAVLSPKSSLGMTNNFAGIVTDVLAKEIEELGNPAPLVVTTSESTSAEASANALKIKAAGTDRVVWFGDQVTGLQTIKAMVAQQYTPLLGGLGSGTTSLTKHYRYPIDRLYIVSTVGGYQPGDGGASEFAAIPDTPASQRCEQALNSTGQKLIPGTGFNLLYTCDLVFLTAEALKASGAEEPSTAAFYDGLAKLAAFDSAYGLKLDFSHGRTGVAQVWDVRGDKACDCQKMTGPHPVERG